MIGIQPWRIISFTNISVNTSTVGYVNRRSLSTEEYVSLSCFSIRSIDSNVASWGNINSVALSMMRWNPLPFVPTAVNRDFIFAGAASGMSHPTSLTYKRRSASAIAGANNISLSIRLFFCRWINEIIKDLKLFKSVVFMWGFFVAGTTISVAIIIPYYSPLSPQMTKAPSYKVIRRCKATYNLIFWYSIRSIIFSFILFHEYDFCLFFYYNARLRQVNTKLFYNQKGNQHQNSNNHQ